MPSHGALRACGYGGLSEAELQGATITRDARGSEMTYSDVREYVEDYITSQRLGGIGVAGPMSYMAYIWLLTIEVFDSAFYLTAGRLLRHNSPPAKAESQG